MKPTEVVQKIGKVFECGDYPDRGLSFSETDADNAIEVFNNSIASGYNPGQNDIEHQQSIFDGKLGGLKKVWRNGKELFGMVEIPRWLDENVLQGAPVGVSLAIHKVKKTIERNGLVKNPRIPDAAVFSMTEAPEEDLIVFNWSAETQELEKDLRKTLTMGNQSTKGSFLKSLFSKAEPEEIEAVFSSGVTLPQPAAQEPVEQKGSDAGKIAALEAQLAKFASENAERAERLIEAEADAFVQKVTSEQKILPANGEPLKALFSIVAKAGAGDLATFSGSATSIDAVKALTDFVSGLPAHKLTQEILEGPVAVFGTQATTPLAGQDDDDLKVDPKELDKLRKAHPMNRGMKASSGGNK